MCSVSLMDNSVQRLIARFEDFEVNLQTGEVWKAGRPLKVQDQPFKVLAALLERPGQIVTREELRQLIWPDKDFGDFDHAINLALTKLRATLGDSADVPHLIETFPRRGYRFIAALKEQSEAPMAVAISPPAPIEVLPVAAGSRVLRPLRGRLALAGFAFLLLLVMGGYLIRYRSNMPTQTLTIVPFTTFPGFEIAPSFSPDGNEIVFSWFGYEKEYQFDLYIKQVGQDHALQLTHHPATFLGSAWSPDGRLIAFMRQADPEGTGIFVISPLGGAERRVADITPLAEWAPLGVSWSADGKWLAFSKANPLANKAGPSAEHFSIHLVNVETGEERQLPDPSKDCGNTWQPSFSPDGKYLASVCVFAGGVAKIYLQDSDGTQARELEDARSSEGFAGIAWAEDSQSLLYSADQHLWRIPVAGGKPEMLLFAQDVESVAVASHGHRLAFAQVHHAGQVFQLALASPTKLTAPAVKLISSTRGDAGAHVSPDGKHIAFQSWRSGNPEVWVCDRDASNPLRLTSFGGPLIGEPRWSPDGRRIVFDLRTDAGSSELYIVDLAGGLPRRFLTGRTEATSPFWSGDGHWIYFNTERPHAIWKAPVEGGAASRLTEEGKDQSEPQEAMDGSRVFFYSGRYVRSVSATGGDERPVPGVPSDVYWVPATGGGYFVDGGPRHFALHHFDTATQHAHKIVDFPNLFAMWGPSLAPDGHALLFSGVEHSEGDIMLAEGFR